MAASRRVILRAGSGSRALPGARPGRSEANVTSSSGAFAMARRHDVTARLNGSVGASLEPVRNLELDGVVMRSTFGRPQAVEFDRPFQDRFPIIGTPCRERLLGQIRLAHRVAARVFIGLAHRFLDAWSEAWILPQNTRNATTVFAD